MFSRYFSPACQRRRRALESSACDILAGRSTARPLTATAWLSLLGLGALLAQGVDIGWLLLPSLLLFAALCVVALFDARYLVIPDGPLHVLVACGFASTIAIAPEKLPERLAAGVLGFLALQALAIAYQRLRGEPGIGQGDARLYGVAGIWLGFDGLPSCLVYATLSALVSALTGLRLGTLKNAQTPLPFGPHLALGLWFAWVFGPIEFG